MTLYQIEVDGLCGFMDELGNVIVQPKFEKLLGSTFGVQKCSPKASRSSVTTMINGVT